jgi:hypothetical protein
MTSSGKVLFTCEERPDLEVREANGMKSYFYKDGFGLSRSHRWEYATESKEGAFDPKERFLPYFATVIEDLPGWATWEPKRYENCQLLTEKHNGYLQFWHEPTKQVLRIAMNSHYYEPMKKKV